MDMIAEKRVAFTLGGRSPLLNGNKGIQGSPRFVKKGFTLAEVLITLAIIGIVAALTLPTVMSNYKKKVVVTKMKKFYTTMNQAVKLSTVENGDTDYWSVEAEDQKFNPDATMDWYNKYLSKHFNGAEAEKINDGIVVRLNDGSGFAIYNTFQSTFVAHVIYYVDYKMFKKWLTSANNKAGGHYLDGKNIFLFRIQDNRFNTYFSIEDDPEKNRSTIMYAAKWGYGCAQNYKVYCAALIEYDGWEIKDDYPVKF